jgi:hypothetical protein
MRPPGNQSGTARASNIGSSLEDINCERASKIRRKKFELRIGRRHGRQSVRDRRRRGSFPYQFERGERCFDLKIDVWVVADAFVCEAYLGGKQVGEVEALDMELYNVVNRLTQLEFDTLMNAAKDVDGSYLDT